jgi:hypothetical protein
LISSWKIETYRSKKNLENERTFLPPKSDFVNFSDGFDDFGWTLRLYHPNRKVITMNKRKMQKNFTKLHRRGVLHWSRERRKISRRIITIKVGVAICVGSDTATPSTHAREARVLL